jgi:hypothetical protein
MERREPFKLSDESVTLSSESAELTPAFLFVAASTARLRRPAVDPLIDVSHQPGNGPRPKLARAWKAALLHHSVDRGSGEPSSKLDLRQPDKARGCVSIFGHELLQAG